MFKIGDRVKCINVVVASAGGTAGNGLSKFYTYLTFNKEYIVCDLQGPSGPNFITIYHDDPKTSPHIGLGLLQGQGRYDECIFELCEQCPSIIDWFALNKEFS
jgi:hypothetical protein